MTIPSITWAIGSVESILIQTVASYEVTWTLNQCPLDHRCLEEMYTHGQKGTYLTWIIIFNPEGYSSAGVCFLYFTRKWVQNCEVAYLRLPTPRSQGGDPELIHSHRVRASCPVLPAPALHSLWSPLSKLQQEQSASPCLTLAGTSYVWRYNFFAILCVSVNNQ